MKTSDITLIFKTILSLDNNTGIVMEHGNQSIAIVKRTDNEGVYYSINDTINKIPNKSVNNECAMTLLLCNAERFKYPVYNCRITKFV